MFDRWGRFVHRHRWPVLLASAVLLALSIVALRSGGELSSGGQLQGNLQAARASRLVSSEITQKSATPGTSFLVLLHSDSLTAADPDFRAGVTAALAGLRADSRVAGVVTPYDVPPALAAGLTSKDSHTVLANVQLKEGSTQAQHYFKQLQKEVRPGALTVSYTGTVPINMGFNSTLESDLQRAEFVSLPVSLILLLLIFGAVVAAALPLGVGVLAIVGGLAGTLLLARVTDVSQYALNIVTLIGLGVAIDYSLFIVNRFREELAAGATREEAMGLTMATAGRAITFSGITVAIGLSAMLFYRGTFLASMGAAGGIVVFVAVFYGLTFLPAMLAVLGPRVDSLRLPRLTRSRETHLWRGIAHGVMRRPLVVLVPALGFLVLAGLPFLHIRLANGDVDMLPPKLPARQAYDQLLRVFPGENQNTFTLVVHFTGGDTSPATHTADVQALAGRAGRLGGVVGVSPEPEWRAGRDITVLEVQSNQPASSDGARTLLKELRAQSVPDGEVLVTGQTAYDVDVIRSILETTPRAVAFVLAVTYLVLFLLTGSLVLPLKALVTNVLSIGASFGALVWIFQDGHLSAPLGFTPQSIDPTIPVILFSIVFGLSMDYEVLLVSRIQEEYRRLGDNTAGVAEGLQRSGRLITGAAAIMFAVFLSFGLAQVVIIKAIGLGLAIAVAIDATLVRALVVPAVMRLLGRWNWWAPHPLRWLHDRVGLQHEPAGGPKAVTPVARKEAS